MPENSKLDASLAALGSAANASPNAGFVDSVWQRAGQLQERADGHRRMALFCGLFVVGLGAGFGTIQTSASANPAPDQITSVNAFSPSALLHVEP
jgi:hypothetical protein